MKYHNILHDNMLNGEGLRVVLFVSGCEHHCKNCQNKFTWDPDTGLDFDESALNEIRDQLDKPYIRGLTLSGGDPLAKYNRKDIAKLCKIIKSEYPDKDIWLYTGYDWEEVYEDYTSDEDTKSILDTLEAICTGKYVEELADVNYHWVGSTNQQVIHVPSALWECSNKIYD